VEVDGQHNAPQESRQLLDEKPAALEQDSPDTSVSITSFEISPGTTKHAAKNPLDQATPSDNPVAPVPAKSAWSKDDDGKGKKGTTASISLRAIQEAEAKRQQTLRANEREKNTRASIVSEAKEDLQTSWGLPTSQAGARSNTYLPAKEVLAPSAPLIIQTSSVSPVWTTTVKTPVAKKSMKEIQEEEEKRKRQAARDNSVPATSKRAYAETTSKASSPV
jgi:PERQ amino acid-rich with GYF domain-containing protein